MTINEVAANPMTVSIAVTLPDGPELVVRPLIKNDDERLGNFLSGLSQTTNSLYQPHPLTREAAKDLCKNLDYTKQLPFIAVTTAGEIVAYFLFDFRYAEHEISRYRKYGIEVDPAKDCRFAPVVADKYQGHGVGKSVFRELLPILNHLPLRSLILSGGTQEGNKQAIAFYKKIGFKLMGEFKENNMRNYDMMLVLREYDQLFLKT